MLSIQQAIFNPQFSDASRRWLFSAGLPDDRLADLERLAEAFGKPSAGIRCSEGMFAQPFPPDEVVIVRVTDGSSESIPPGPLRFHFLLVQRSLYKFLSDPFVIADQFPVVWSATGSLPELEWPADYLPHRTTEQLQGVLKEGDSPLLLGAAQVVVDTGRLILERTGPDTRTLRGLWALLPHSTRAESWPATFAFAVNQLDLHAVVMPQLPEPLPPGYLTEEQALDYPESRYERELQIAIEADDQSALDRLLARRSSAQTMRLAVYLIVILMVLAIGMKMLNALPVR